MANHKSAKKNTTIGKKNAANSYFHKTTRNAMRKLRVTSNKKKQ